MGWPEVGALAVYTAGMVVLGVMCPRAALGVFLMFLGLGLALSLRG